jgi:hypothetical protein
MKTIYSLILLFLTANAFAQDATLYHSDGTVLKVKVTASSDAQLFTNKGNYDYAVIDSISTSDKVLKDKFNVNKAKGPRAVVPTSLIATKKIFVEGVDINALTDVEFIQVVGGANFFSNDIKIFLYYGQKLNFLASQRVEGEDGRPIKFNGMIDALNFMYKNGWEFVDAFESQGETRGDIATYLLRRKH